MARTIDISVPPETSDELVSRIQGKTGIAGITVLPGGSVSPPGDVVTIQATNRAMFEVMEVVGELGFLEKGSLVISEPTAIVAPAHRQAIENQTNEAAWEEMLALLRRDSNLSYNFLALMALSGGIAAVGLIEDTIHIVVGAMLVAPGFEPLVRTVLGPLSGSWNALYKGLLGTLVGYLMLALGAGVTLLIAAPLHPAMPSDLSSLHWVQYWTSFKWLGVVTAFLAGFAGAAIVNSRRTVFAAGVMVALALIPAMSIFGMGLASGDVPLALQGLARWGLEVACVLAASTLVITAKRALVHRRTALS